MNGWHTTSYAGRLRMAYERGKMFGHENGFVPDHMRYCPYIALQFMHWWQRGYRSVVLQYQVKEDA